MAGGAARAGRRWSEPNNELAEATRWIQVQIVAYGLTLEGLEAAGCFDPLPPPPPPVLCYRNAEGLSWDGQGEMPTWLRRAVNAGQSVEFFRIG
ncbi:H-NS family nucleoid-associated regulatory protein [Cupriavidus pinatubonensis]|uniref:H-NS family nucleoid-associated regulatory protein n=1 Tax=Cupriavidus pinatubonensis TaxID=248026 RepID=UPI00360C4AB4